MRYLYSLIIACPFFISAEFVPSDEFIAYHISVAVNEVEDEGVFQLIQENVNNLQDCTARENATIELLHLIQEGYKIDSYNMAKLINTLTYVDASQSAKRVIIKAIEYQSLITVDHITALIKTLGNVSAAENATEILLKAIQCGISFGLKERTLLAEMSKQVSAKKNVEKIRKALRERDNLLRN